VQVVKGSSFHYKNQLLESTPKACFQEADFGFASAFGASKTKISFIIRIAESKGKNGAKRRLYPLTPILASVGMM
jgi:hypothetical protein